MPDRVDLSDLGFQEVKSTENSWFFDLGGRVEKPGAEPPPPAEEFGGNEFSRGVARSALGAAASGLDFLRSLSVDESPRLKKMADDLLADARQIPTKAGSIRDVLDDPGMAPAYVSRVLGELAPQAVLAYLTGGVGRAAAGAAGAGRAGVRAATGAGVAVTSVPQEAGSIYRETEERTGKGDTGAALAYGVPAGLLDSLSAERVISKVFNAGAEEARRRAWRQVVRDAVKEIPKTAGIESVTEATQEVLAVQAQRAADETFDQLTPENGWRVLESAVAGAIGGGAFGGIGAATSVANQRAGRSQRAQELRLIRQVRDDIRSAQRTRQAPPEAEPVETETGFTRFPVSPTTDESRTIVEPSGETPIDELLARGRAVVPSTGRGFVRYAPTPTTDESGTILPVEGETQIDRLLAEQDPEVPEFTDQPPAQRLLPAPLPADRESEAVNDQIQNLIGAVYQREDGVVALVHAGTTGGPSRPYRITFFRGDTPIDHNDFSGEQSVVEYLKNGAYPGKWKHVTTRTPDAIQVQQAAPVPVREQTQTRPQVVEEVREQAPTQEKITNALVDLSTVKDAEGESSLPVSLTIPILYDPIASQPGKKKESRAKKTEGVIRISGASRYYGQLTIGIRTSAGQKPRVAWKASVSDLEQAGLIQPVDAGGGRVGYRIPDLDKLYASPLLEKSGDRHFLPYKLPSEEITRSLGIDIDAVVNRATEISPFTGEILKMFQNANLLNEALLRKLATRKGSTRAAVDTEPMANQLVEGLSRMLKLEGLSAQEKGDKETSLALLQASEIVLGNADFSPADVQEVAAYISDMPAFDSLLKAREEFKAESLDAPKGGRKSIGTGEEIQIKDVRGTEQDTNRRWSDAQVDEILGRIESQNPDLFQMFEAEFDDDQAWVEIESELAKFLKGDKAAAEVLSEEIRELRRQGPIASLAGKARTPREEFVDETSLTGVSAQGKSGIQSLLENRNIRLDPEMRRIGLALIRKLPDKYLKDLTLSVTLDGSLEGEFIPWMKVARIAANSTKADVAAHEIAHYLATFLTNEERAVISRMRKEDLRRIERDHPNFVDWVESLGGSARSDEYASHPHPAEDVGEGLYHLINDDEYFAHYVSQAAANRPELNGVIAKVKDIVRRIVEAVKAWFGVKPEYFTEIIRRFEKGEFDVNARGGMLFERNNQGRPKMIKPILSTADLERFQQVDQGTEESEMVRALTIEQNEPIVGHILNQLRELPARIKSELQSLVGRSEAYLAADPSNRPQQSTPVRDYAFVVNALSLQKEAVDMGHNIESMLKEFQALVKREPTISAAEARSNAMKEILDGWIADYRNELLSKKRAAWDDGMKEGLARTIDEINKLQNDTVALQAAVNYLASFPLEQITSKSTAELVRLFQKSITLESKVPDWQMAKIPARGGMPSVADPDIIRTAVNMMKARLNLGQDILTLMELSDDQLRKAISAQETDFDKEIQELNKNSLRQFLSSYKSLAVSRDRARKVYLDHRRRVRDLIERIDSKVQAEDFLWNNVLTSQQFLDAMERASLQGFMAAELIRDGKGNDILKRTYFNPRNREEKVEIIDGFSKADWARNRDLFEKVTEWFTEALGDPRVDELDKQRITIELQRIESQENDPAFNPEYGKNLPGLFNANDWLANLVGNSQQYALSKIGGRAAVQATAVSQARAEARRRVAEVRHDLQYPLQKAVLEAARGHTTAIPTWLKEVAEPVLASFNSLGAKQIRVGDTTRYGRKVSAQDMVAIKAMKTFSDAMTKAVADMSLHTAQLHPIRVREMVFGRELLRPQQGHSDYVLPRRFRREFLNLISTWNKTKSGRRAVEAVSALRGLVETGEPFSQLVLGHIYSTQRYPDYVGQTRYKKAYREIYNLIESGSPPSSFGQVVDRVFDNQRGEESAQQQTKEEIAAEIVQELDGIASRIEDEQNLNRAADTPGTSVSVQSADNFLTKPRGEMIAPDSAYQYSIALNQDLRWMTRSVLEVHEQLARDGLEKIQKMLSDYVREFGDRTKYADPQKETRARQLSGEDWLNYREAKQMLNQVNRLLDRISPEAFQSFIDEQFAGIGRRMWRILIQSLLQSPPVLVTNALGMDLRLWQMEQQWRGDGLWMGMPKWLLKLPTMAKNGILWPVRDIPAFIASGRAYKKVKGQIGEEGIRAVIDNPDLARAHYANISGSMLKRAMDVQRAHDLGAAGPYGIRNQVERYFTLFNFGGEMEYADPTWTEKQLGRVASILGLIEETGGGIMLPRAAAPRKLEQFLNFQAIRHANRMLDELRLNMLEAVRDRRELGRNDPVTDMELLGDPKATTGDARFMRELFRRGGINLDAVMARLQSEPDRPLLRNNEWNSFVLEVAKEANMPSADNRVQFRSGFGRVMSSLMGYSIWYNERMADALAWNSRKKVDVAALYRGLWFISAIAVMGVFIRTPLVRLIKWLFFNEEDQTPRFQADNTGWRNAAVLAEQTANFWPMLGSIITQLYEARQGNKMFNFLPVSVAQTILRSGNEIGQTGNVMYPTLRLVRQLLPNTRVIVNRLPWMDGSVEINNAARVLRETATGQIEIRQPSFSSPIRYTPASTEIQLAVNEVNRGVVDWDRVGRYRDAGAKYYMKMGANKKDAYDRFDRAVMARMPQNIVYGRRLTDEESSSVVGRLSPNQYGILKKVEEAFNRYSERYGSKQFDTLTGGSRRTRTPRLGRTSRLVTGRRRFSPSRRRRTPRLVRSF